MFFPIPLKFHFNVIEKDENQKNILKAALLSGQKEKIFKEVAIRKPHTFIISRYISDYLSRQQGFTNILEFGVDAIKDYMILERFPDKKIEVFDNNNRAIETAQKSLLRPNLKIGKFDLVTGNYEELKGKHDSLFFFQMESCFSDNELKNFSEDIRSIGIVDILIASPSVFCMMHLKTFASIIKRHLLRDRNKGQHITRNLKCIHNCFKKQFPIMKYHRYYTYDYPYYIIHLKAKR